MSDFGIGLYETPLVIYFNSSLLQQCLLILKVHTYRPTISSYTRVCHFNNSQPNLILFINNTMHAGGITKTYSKKNRSTINSSSSIYLTDVTNRETAVSPLTNNTKPKRKFDSEDGQENVSVVSLSRSASTSNLESSGTTELQKVKVNKRANGVEDVIATSPLEYLSALSKCLDECNGKKKMYALDLHNYAYMTHDYIEKIFPDPDRFSNWLRDIGFEECNRGDHLIYKLPQAKV